MSFIKDFLEIKNQIVQLIRPLKFSDKQIYEFEENDTIIIILENEEIEIGLFLMCIADRVIFYRNIKNQEINEIYPEEVNEINLLISNKIKKEIQKYYYEMNIIPKYLLDDYIINYRKFDNI